MNTSITKRVRWFVSGVRCKLNRQSWHMIMSYDEETKKEENVALVWFDLKTGEGFSDAHKVAASPEMLEVLKRLDAWWTEDLPGGPDGPREIFGGLGQISEDTCNIWRAIREAIGHAEGRH